MIDDALNVARAIRRTLREPGRRRRRMAIAMKYFAPSLARAQDWSKETSAESNFEYSLTDRSLSNLAHTIATIFGIQPADVRALFAELDADEDLRQTVGGALYSRRVGWYAIARLLKPRLIIETGVDAGLGSCVMCAALLRNASEGHPGRYIGTEIRTEAGFLLTGRYREVGTIVYGDSLQTIRKMSEPIDLFINDSDHSAEYEMSEYEEISRLLSPKSIILGDNSHVTSSLSEYSERTGRQFLFFRDEPKDHWYPGAGIGFSFTQR